MGTAVPTEVPTASPTESPTLNPTAMPTLAPTSGTAPNRYQGLFAGDCSPDDATIARVTLIEPTLVDGGKKGAEGGMVVTVENVATGDVQTRAVEVQDTKVDQLADCPYSTNFCRISDRNSRPDKTTYGRTWYNVYAFTQEDTWELSQDIEYKITFRAISGTLEKGPEISYLLSC